MSELTENQSLIDAVRSGGKGDIIIFNHRGIECPVLARPTTAGVVVESVKKFVDEYLPYPERRRGTATLLRLQSLIDHAIRFKTTDSALFAWQEPTKASLRVVLDYHQATVGTETHAGNLSHQGIYNFPLAKEWKAWENLNGKEMSQADFAIFLENRILDVQPVPMWNLENDADIAASNTVKLLGGAVAGPERLMELSRGLAVHENSQVKNAVNLSSGEGNVTFETEHVDGEGNKLLVPSIFFVGIPVFDADTAYRILVRLRYRKRGPGIVWFYEMHRIEAVFKDAFETACQKAATDTGLPLFYGAPEAAAT